MNFYWKPTPVPGVYEVTKIPRTFFRGVPAAYRNRLPGWEFSTPDFPEAAELTEFVEWLAVRSSHQIFHAHYVSPQVSSTYLHQDNHADPTFEGMLTGILGKEGTLFPTIAGSMWQAEPGTVYYVEPGVWHRSPVTKTVRLLLRWRFRSEGSK